MKRAISFTALIFILLSLVSCSNDSAPTTPPTPPIPDCEKYGTAQITFENKSGSNTTYDVVWDGAKITTIAPGTKSQEYTELAGTHTLLYKITNTSWVACSFSSPVLVECQSYTSSCSF